jgi:asparagine synthase (glutamine-hydrolysing)
LNRLALLPYPARQAQDAGIHALPMTRWDALSYRLNALPPGGKGIVFACDKAHKLAACLGGVRNLDGIDRRLVFEWQDPAEIVKGISGFNKGVVLEPPSLLDDPFPLEGVEQSQLRMIYRDSTTYLPDDISCKVGLAVMPTSLETRESFLDHRVAELAWQLSLNMKVLGNESKWALRQVLYKHVPRELIDRPKAGFGIQVGQWLREPLRDWAGSLHSESRLQTEGHFHPSPISAKWAEHLNDWRDHRPALWTVLMFQTWLEQVS